MRYIISERQYHLLTEQDFSKSIVSGISNLKLNNRISNTQKSVNSVNEPQTNIKPNSTLEFQMERGSYWGSEWEKAMHQYCEEKPIPSEFVKKYIPVLQKNLNREMEAERYNYTRGMHIPKKFNKIIDDIISEAYPYLWTITSKTFYSMSGLMKYDQITDAIIMINKMEETLMNIFKGLFKTTADVFVTKKNVGEIKKEISDSLSKYIGTTINSLNYITTSTFLQMVDDYRKNGPKCNKIAITRDWNGNTIPPKYPTYPIKGWTNDDGIYSELSYMRGEFSSELNMVDVNDLKGILQKKIFAVVDTLV